MPRRAGDEPARPARIADVAALAGVSPSLVSRLLNGDSRLQIRDDTRRSIEQAVRDLGYVANSTAKALRGARTGTLGLVLEHVTSPMFTEIVHGAQRAASEAGVVLLLIDAADARVGSEHFVDMIRSRRVDGLLLQGGYEPDDALLEYAELIPSVTINSTGTAKAGGVRLQDDDAAELATRHLIELGHRVLAFVAGDSGGSSSERRGQGFRRAVRRLGGRSTRSRMIGAGWELEESRAAVARVLDRPKRPTGYVVANSGEAVGVLAALHEHGLRVPRDASVIGIHDTWFAPHLTPALSTVKLPQVELGRRSVTALLERIDGGPPREVLIDDPAPLLIARKSTGPAPTSS